ncbi:MAG: HNH endonuclease signature motif containing protein [Culicoidibacterales bacterium]
MKAEIPNYSGYFVTEDGSLYSKNYKRMNIEKKLKPALDANGYLRTMLLNNNGVYNTVKVHRIVASAFLGICPIGYEVNHKDGDKTNNAIYNLEYLTHAENCQHSFDTGLQKPQVGEENGFSKLTQAQVDYARELKKINGRYWGRNELAKEYGIAPKHLQRIVNKPHLSWYMK